MSIFISTGTPIARRPAAWLHLLGSLFVAATLAACGGGGVDTDAQVAAATTTTESASRMSPLAASADAVSGAIFTTDVNCTATNGNLYALRTDVYLDGGPRQPGAAGLPDGLYFVKVTTPDGDLLGVSPTASVTVAGGEITSCPQVWSLTLKASDGSQGFDATDNPGGVYKLWISKNGAFPPSDSKTDNFKAEADDPSTPLGTLVVKKFYDANMDGVKQPTEPLIDGWKVNVTFGAATSVQYTTYTDPLALPGAYGVSEVMPDQKNWFATTPTSVNTTVIANQTTEVMFGNVCTGAGGGLTLGFWSNRNGQSLVGADDLSMLVALNLRDAVGGGFDPANYTSLRNWLLSASATNMAYMLSAQLTAMALNVHNGKVNGAALIYAPGTGLGNSLGFASVNDVMSAANTALGVDGFTLSGDPNRAAQEALKNALDAANNNQNFAQSQPCAFSFTATP